MDLEAFRNYCLNKAGTEETLPFGPDALVYKVYGKVYAITSLNSETFTVNLKCDPDHAVELREMYTEIIPGWHMNKKHWNTVNMQGSLKDSFLRELIDQSYDLILKKLPKSKLGKS